MDKNDSLAIENLLQKLKKQGENAETLPTAIYARKSTKDTSGVSLEGQINACFKYVTESDKLRLVEVYSEDNVSGYDMNRKEIQKLIAKVKSKQIRVIVSYSLDRISRNIIDGGTLDKELEESGALILYATQSFANNADGNFTKNILRAVAQRQPENTAENSMRSALSNARKSEHNGGVAPYGFTVVNKKYAIDEKEAPAVKLMYKGILSGLSISEVIENLTNKGFMTRANKAFSPQTVHRILTNVKYKGTYFYNRQDVKKRKRKVLRQDYDEVRINGGIPQIIDEVTFNKVQVLLNKKTPKSSPKAKEPYVLTGLLKCGCCGNTMHGYASIRG